jgi:dCMP deaminase
MIGATLYLSGCHAKTGELLEDTIPCSMCRRMIINSGIIKTICRVSEGKNIVIHTRDWVFNDDSIIDSHTFSNKPNEAVH